MKKLFKIKPFLWLFLAIIIGLGLNFLITEFRFVSDIKIAQAGDEHSVTGFAWSENIGWISFNSTDCDADRNGFVDTNATNPGCNGDNATDDVFNYGVHINNGLGHFSGYAWSSNVGWIAFETTMACDGNHKISCSIDGDCGSYAPCVQHLPPDYNFNDNCDSYNDGIADNDCESSNNCTACLDIDGNAGNGVYGWAKIVSMGDDGWIRLDDNDTGDAFNFGVSQTGDELAGWAWNNRGLCDDGITDCADNTPCGAGTCDTTSIGIGWISFNCLNEGGNFCTSFPYSVALDLKPSQPVIYEVIPNPNDKCSGLMVRWVDDPGSFQTNFRIYRQGSAAPEPASGSEIATVDGITYQYPDYNPLLSPGDHYYYFVDAFDSNVPAISEMSEPLDGTTYLICKVDGSAISGIGECPNKITLSWPEDPNAGYYNIIRCNLTDLGDCDVLGNYYGNADYASEGWSQLPAYDLYETTDSCYSPDSSHCSAGICICVDQEISDVPADGEMYDKYVYKIQTASSTLGQYSSWSDPSDPIRPCTMFPVWREVR